MVSLCWITLKAHYYRICVESHQKTPFDQSVLNYIENTLLQNLSWITPKQHRLINLCWITLKTHYYRICVEPQHHAWSVLPNYIENTVCGQSVASHTENTVCDQSMINQNWVQSNQWWFTVKTVCVIRLSHITQLKLKSSYQSEGKLPDKRRLSQNVIIYSLSHTHTSTHVRAHTQARTHGRTRAHTHTPTHTNYCSSKIILFLNSIVTSQNITHCCEFLSNETTYQTQIVHLELDTDCSSTLSHWRHCCVKTWLAKCPCTWCRER